MYTRKMVLMPFDATEREVLTQKNDESSEPTEPKGKRTEREVDKIRKMLMIVLRIGAKDSYTEDFKIKDSNGNPITESDLIALLNNALTHEKYLVGEDDFIRLMYEANVNPLWIINENIRAKLKSYSSKKTQNPPKDPPNNPPLTPPVIPTSPNEPPLQPHDDHNYSFVGPKNSNYFDSDKIEITPQTEEVKTTTKRRISEPNDQEEEIKSKKQKTTSPWEVPLPSDDDDDL